MAKLVKIFVSKADLDLKDEQAQLESFTQSLNDKLIRDDVFVMLVDDEQTGDDPSEVLHDSQAFYALVGDSLTDAFENAYRNAESEREGKETPIIKTFIKEQAKSERRKASAQKFIDSLERGEKPYDYFSHVDTIKLNFLLELCESPYISESLDFKDGNVLLGRIAIMPLDDVPLYSNNDAIQSLREEISDLDAKLVDVVVENKGADRATLAEKIAEINKKRDDACEKLHRTESAVFELFSRISKKDGPETWRTREASRLLNSGDYDAALAILNDPLREAELSQGELMGSAAIEDIEGYIREELLAIHTMIESNGDAAFVDEAYGKIASLAMDNVVALDAVYEYAAYLRDLGRSEEALRLAERLLLIQQSLDHVSNEDIARTEKLIDSLAK